MKHIFIAEDGKQFDSFVDCASYESQLVREREELNRKQEILNKYEALPKNGNLTCDDLWMGVSSEWIECLTIYDEDTLKTVREFLEYWSDLGTDFPDESHIGRMVLINRLSYGEDNIFMGLARDFVSNITDALFNRPE